MRGPSASSNHFQECSGLTHHHRYLPARSPRRCFSVVAPSCTSLVGQPNDTHIGAVLPTVPGAAAVPLPDNPENVCMGLRGRAEGVGPDQRRALRARAASPCARPPRQDWRCISRWSATQARPRAGSPVASRRQRTSHRRRMSWRGGLLSCRRPPAARLRPTAGGRCACGTLPGRR